MIRCALISDIHFGYNNRTLQVLLDYFRTYAAASDRRQKIDVWIIAGDLGCSEQEQVYKCLKFLRKQIPEPTPIILVYGNHDLWSPLRDYKYGRMTYATINALHRKWEDEFNIHYLPNKPFILDGVIFLGFDGWYKESSPPTNDVKNLGFTYIESAPAMVYLSDKAAKDLDALLQTPTEDYRKVVGVTHFPTFSDNEKYEPFSGNPKFLPFMTEKCDVWCFGHSHRQEIRVVDGCLLLNSGSGYQVKYVEGTEHLDEPLISEIYNAPKHIVFDI